MSTPWRSLKESYNTMRSKQELSEEKQEALGELTEAQVDAITQLLNLDEISASKLGRYASKAVKSGKKAEKDMDDSFVGDDMDKAKFKKGQRTMMKRNKGVDRALDKIKGSSFVKVHATDD